MKMKSLIFTLTVLTVFLIFSNSCKKDNSSPVVKTPVLSTLSVNNVTKFTASCGGNITSDGGAEITARGICWSKSTYPTIADSITADGTGIGIFTSSLDGLIAGTTYTVKAYATNSAGTGYGNSVSFITIQPTIPILTTSSASDITYYGIKSGGIISSDGGSPITTRGVCWSTETPPTIANNKTTDGNGAGNFISETKALNPNTTYYLAAYASNSAGTGYGNIISFTTPLVTDIDGNIYHTVTIGTQIWLLENLRTTKYRNGDLIGTTTMFDVSGEIMPKYQWPCRNDESFVPTYGRFYTWYVVADSRGISPVGWHVSTYSDWITLTEYLSNNGYGYQGNKRDIAKSIASTWGWGSCPNGSDIRDENGSIIGWNFAVPCYDTLSNNSSGFTALPCGEIGGWYFGYETAWWTSTEYIPGNTAYFIQMLNGESRVGPGYVLNGKSLAWSVRCVRDN